MNENTFDKHIKDNLYNYESPISSGLWDRIVAEKDKKKPVPPPFWKNGYLQSAVIAVVAITLLTSTYSSLFKNNTQVSNATNKQNNTVVNTPINVSNTKTTNTTSTVNKVTKVSDNQKEISLNTITNNSTIKENSFVSLSNKIVTNKETIPATRLIVDTKKQVLTTETNESVATVSISKTDIVKETTPTPLVNNESVTYDKLSYFPSQGELFLKPDNVLTNLLVTKQLSGSKSSITHIHIPDAPTKSWSIELYGSPDYNTQKVVAIGLNTDYLRTLDTTQKVGGGFTVGVHIAKSLNKHLSIKSGLQFKDIIQEFNYKQNVTKTINVFSTRSYIDNTGASVNLYDTSSYQQTGYRLKKTFNSFKSIQLPLIASWETGNTNWHFALDGGLLLNLVTYYEGATFDPNYNLVPLNAKETNGLLKSNFSYNLYGGISLYRSLGTNLEAYVAPYYSYALSNSSTSIIGYNQRFNTGGINFGIRYKISSARGNKY